MQNGVERAEEAGDWLKNHFKDEVESKADITLVVGRANPLIYHEVMEILFGPPIDNDAS